MKKPYGDLKSIDKSKEVEIPVHPFPFPELRPYQHEVFKHIQESDKPFPQYFFPRARQMGTRFVGIDVGQKDGDKSVIVQGVPDGKGGFSIIAIDEYADFPDYKWYRNPIKWFKFRKVMKIIERNYKR